MRNAPIEIIGKSPQQKKGACCGKLRATHTATRNSQLTDIARDCAQRTPQQNLIALRCCALFLS